MAPTSGEYTAADTFLDQLAADPSGAGALAAELTGRDLLAEIFDDPRHLSLRHEFALVGAAYGPGAADRCWDLLAGCGNDIAAGSAAWNADTPTRTLEALAASTSTYVLEGLAANPSTPPELLAGLWARHPGCAEHLVDNPSCPTGLLAALRYSNWGPAQHLWFERHRR
jgi:hypothetical protein